MAEILLPLLTTILGIGGTLGAIYLKSHLVERSKTNCIGKVEKTIDEDILVLREMDEMLSDLNADRVSIYSFHNGGEFYSGKSMQKMSISYETVAAGVSRNQLIKQSVPISACLTTLHPLVKEKQFHVADVEKNYPEGLCKFHLQEDGTKSTYQWALIDLNDNIIGMLRIDYVKECVKLSKETLRSTLIRAIKLPGYLVNRK